MILARPVILPITLYRLDDFDLQLNWRERCGATYDLTDYIAKMTFWASKTDRSSPIYTLNSPPSGSTGISLSATIPNFWAHIAANIVDFDPVPQWYIIELTTPSGADTFTDGVIFRFAEGKVTYEV